MQYGRNFEFLVGPQPWQRAGRFAVPASGSRLLIGTPVVAGTDFDSRTLRRVAAAAATTALVPGQSGILIYEYGIETTIGFDPRLMSFSDLDSVPLDSACLVVSGSNIKVRLRNTAATTLFGRRTYAARTMVAGDLATLAVGTGLRPVGATASDTNGYWTASSGSEPVWMRVTQVDVARGEVEAQLAV